MQYWLSIWRLPHTSAAVYTMMRKSEMMTRYFNTALNVVHFLLYVQCVFQNKHIKFHLHLIYYHYFSIHQFNCGID